MKVPGFIPVRPFLEQLLWLYTLQLPDLIDTSKLLCVVRYLTFYKREQLRVNKPKVFSKGFWPISGVLTLHLFLALLLLFIIISEGETLLLFYLYKIGCR